MQFGKPIFLEVYKHQFISTAKQSRATVVGIGPFTTFLETVVQNTINERADHLLRTSILVLLCDRQT